MIPLPRCPQGFCRNPPHFESRLCELSPCQVESSQGTRLNESVQFRVVFHVKAETLFDSNARRNGGPRIWHYVLRPTYAAAPVVPVVAGTGKHDPDSVHTSNTPTTDYSDMSVPVPPAHLLPPSRVSVCRETRGLLDSVSVLIKKVGPSRNVWPCDVASPSVIRQSVRSFHTQSPLIP